MKQEIGIWKYSELLPPIEKKYRKSLAEGSTGIVEAGGICFKCEFENPTGSVKDRGICYQIAELSQKGRGLAVISSSGNAAISASKYCRLHKIGLTVFVSSLINKSKLAKIDEKTKVKITKTPLKDSFRVSQTQGVANLRPSINPVASVGYQTLSFEIAAYKKEIDAVFIPVSSGVALKGIYQGFTKLNLSPALHAVQTTRIHPLAAKFDSDFRKEDQSLASAIVAKYLPLEQELIGIINKTRGSAWVIGNSQMQEYKSKLASLDLDASYEGAAAYAAVIKAKARGFDYKNPVCILTGQYYQND